MCDWCRACCSGEEEDPDREVIIYMNDREANAPFEYPSNYIVTSKYTLWSFLPMALAMQFTKASNVYFLINMIFSLIPGVAPVSPATAIAPLCFVLIVALIKEAVEDIRRHQADDKANDIPAEVLVGDKLKSVPSSKIVVGDIIRVNIGEEIRADMLLCASSVVEGQAFIDTCNLDGETNLKSRRALEATWGLCSEEAFLSAKMVVRTKAPDPGLLSWGGVVQYDGNELAVSLDQFMYRGCVLRNTDWIWGVVLYAGVDTKMFRNLKEKPPKSSTLDKRLNWVIIVIFVVQNIFLFIVCSLACWFNHQHKDYWYMEYFINYYTGITLWGYRYLSYFMLFSYFIPISLFVTIELCKVVQAHWMRVDAEMMEYMDGRWRHCTPNTSNLNEQLALVKFIFSDKTGTLTENVMKYKLGDALGVPIDRDSLTDVAKRLRGGGASDESTALLEEYFLALALCNTIQPFRDEDREGGILYEGSSPDEIALVDTASQVGFTLANRTTRTMTITRGDVACVFNILATLEFTPERKMMSIIVEDPNTRKLTLYNKGADSFVLPQLSRDPKVQSDADAAVGVLKEMSSEGLRTLMVCAKDITRSEFDAWNARFMEAGKLLQNRAEEVDKVCLEMEKDMRLIGLTAIEDKLQDQVPETLSFFLSAGVVIWMLTGDKRETAVTIAATSTLCDPRTDFIDHVDLGSLDPEDDKAIEKVRDDLHVVEQHLNLAGTEEERKCTLVIDGPALTVAMENFAEKFLEISERVNSAVCCRLTPIQKANVVHMFQTASGHTALAIGDGANDVSMIQEGKVGVGIMGLEGAQAALAADYAIPRFKHLRRLCAVHGRYALLRNATCIMVSFYKNITLSLLQFIFACYAGYSAQTLFDGWLLTFYNVALTSITPFLTGIFEKDLPEDALMERPKLFTPLADGLYFNPMVFLRWSIEATAHSLVLYYLSMPKTRMLGSWTSNIAGDVCGTLIFCGLIAVVLTRFCIAIRYWQWIQLLGVIISIVALIVFVVVYSLIPSVMGDSSFYWQLFNLMRGAEFWLTMIFYIGTVLVVDLSILHFQKRLFPTIRDLAEREYFASRRTRKHDV